MDARRQQLTRRGFVAGAAAAGLAAASFDPLSALARGGRARTAAAPLLGTAWTDFAQGLVTNGHAPGVGYAWVDADGPVAAGFGSMTQGGPSNVAGDTIFELGSVTKVFTTTLLALTLDTYSGVTLNTKIGQYLPSGVTNTAINNVTLGQLACYTNCISRNAPGQNSANYTTAQLVKFLNGGKSVVSGCTPRSTYFYSNLAVGLLGLCLGVIQSNDIDAWTQLVVDQIASPLGMVDTVRSTTQSASQQARTATGYNKSGNAATPLADAPFLGGGGALVSTANDMLRFLQAQLNPSSAPAALQGPIAAAQKFKFKLSSQAKSKTVYTRVGLGWFLGRANGSPGGLVSKNGGTTGFASYIGYVPSQDIGLFAVVNHTGVTLGSAGASYLRGGSTAAVPLDRD